MGKLINSTSFTVDGLTDVGSWYVAEGEHDRAGIAHLGGDRVSHRAQVVRGLRRILAAPDRAVGRRPQPDAATSFDSRVTLLRYEPVLG